MPPTETTSSSAAACEPDIEDLIKCEASDVAASNAMTVSTQHDTARHDFRPEELQATRTELLAWYDAHRRKLPWRGDPPPYLTTATHTSQKKKAAAKKTGLETFLKKEVEDIKRCKLEEEVAMDSGSAMKPRKVAPYETWVSEIMLQQTRVDTVDVNALWAGLGYYRRARMLHAGAKSNRFHRLWKPRTISRRQCNSRDGRVRAVGSDPKNKQLINFSWKAAKELVGECDRPGSLNQALMELGATMCTVQVNPQCSGCPVKSVCLAYEEANTVKPKSESTSAESSTESSNSCSICDYTRVTEWDETHTEVTKYPLKAKKNDSRNEIIAVAVVSAPCDSLTEETTAPTRGKRKASKSVEADASPSGWRFLMSKRPEGGLLAGQWEFLHSKMSDGDKIPSFSKRKTFMDSRLTDIFGKTALIRSGKLTPERRDLGELTHIFSHVKHHMGIEHLHFKSQPELLVAAESDELHWMTVAEMKQRGITTGVKRSCNLCCTLTRSPARRRRPRPSRLQARLAQSHTSHMKNATYSDTFVQYNLSCWGNMAYVEDAVAELIPRVVALDIDDEVEDVDITKAPATPERVIYFRDLDSWDIPQVRVLHEEWFPIRYNQAFYDGAAQGMWMETGGPLFARLAVEMQPSTDLQTPVQPNPEDRRDENILGAVTASTLPLSKVDDPDLISPDDWEHTHIMYILTLGTRSSVRRMGIASALLRSALLKPVVNRNYYMIDGVRHDAFLYIRYVNGAAPQSGWFDLITSSPRITQPASKGRGKNELDDLLDMLGDEDSKPAAVHPRSSRAGAYNSSDTKISRTEFQAGGTKKACSNLRCNECDFTVVQFPGKNGTPVRLHVLP
ncbi:MutY, C-terminal [Phytophthora cactorum]|nr:MutY, C-terminal [Phytophthora cactorum]